MNKINQLVEKQRVYFFEDETKKINFRLAQLKKLKDLLKQYEKDIYRALNLDLGKSEFESLVSELAFVYQELDFFIKKLPRLIKPKSVRSGILTFPASAKIIYEPYGVVLVMSPWNYPLQLSLIPLLSALAAGNCVVLKPSNYALHTSNLLAKIINDNFEDRYLYVVEGGRSENKDLLEAKFDYIFFTGSPEVGKLVMEKAARYLTPVTLELGGKSPCIIDETADLKLSVKRIVWGKFLNGGQTCIAPDYIYLKQGLKEDFVKYFQYYVEKMYGSNPLLNDDYGKIINEKHFKRLKALLNNQQLLYGGNLDFDLMKIEPTLVLVKDFKSPLMQEEIFGPILPVLEYKELADVIKTLKGKPKPLALYLFSTSSSYQEEVINSLSFGGGCINDVLVHFTSTKLPFGGVGESGMGKYHGLASYKTFSHAKGIIKKANWLDINVRYAPYKGKLKLAQRIFKRGGR